MWVKGLCDMVKVIMVEDVSQIMFFWHAELHITSIHYLHCTAVPRSSPLHSLDCGSDPTRAMGKDLISSYLLAVMRLDG